jgi:uncharacterized protein
MKGASLNQEPLSLSHREYIQKACHTLQIPISEYNFSNLYLFRDVHAYEFLELSPGKPAIKGISYTKKPFLMPLFNPTDWDELISLSRNVKVDHIFPIPEGLFTKCDPKSLVLLEEDFDYVYNVQTITTYGGRHLDGQRNHVKNLLSKHNLVVVPYSPNLSKNAYHIIETWEKEKDFPVQSDASACIEAIDLFTELNLTGYMFQVDGNFSGFILGEELTNDTFLIHFTKAIGRIRGIYQYMYQELAKTLLPKYTWMNWEEDLGIESLRYAKRAYHPAFLIKKGRLTISHDFNLFSPRHAK